MSFILKTIISFIRTGIPEDPEGFLVLHTTTSWKTVRTDLISWNSVAGGLVTSDDVDLVCLYYLQERESIKTSNLSDIDKRNKLIRAKEEMKTYMTYHHDFNLHRLRYELVLGIVDTLVMDEEIRTRYLEEVD